MFPFLGHKKHFCIDLRENFLDVGHGSLGDLIISIISKN